LSHILYILGMAKNSSYKVEYILLMPLHELLKGRSRFPPEIGERVPGPPVSNSPLHRDNGKARTRRSVSEGVAFCIA
jgi:hypothetical protein